MIVLTDTLSIAQLEDGELRNLIEQRVEALAEFDDYEMKDLVTFVVVEPGDTLDAIDRQLGRPFSAPSHELIEEHAGYFEIVYVLSDDGFGIEVFIPKVPGVDPALLAFCATYATPTQENHDE